MASVSTIVLYLTAIVFFFGQLLRLNFLNISFPLLDIFIIALAAINLIFHLKTKTIQIKNRGFLYFLIFTWITFFINYFLYHNPIITPLFYLIRLTCLLSLIIVPLSSQIFKEKFKRFFLICLFSDIIFGFIQYLFWPNFIYFNALNWDPHTFRLVGTFFDPTFTGLIFLLFLLIIFFNKNINFRIPILIISYLAIALTYSRTSYLVFIIAFAFISMRLKQPKILITSILIIILTVLILPRLPGESTKLERTSSIFAKIENYKEGISVFSQSPLIGHGYNNLVYIRHINIPNSHSNSGFDSSLLTILATTGLIGGLLFLTGIKDLFFHSDLLLQTLLLTVFIHSFFSNSLLYPWVLLILCLTPSFRYRT